GDLRAEIDREVGVVRASILAGTAFDYPVPEKVDSMVSSGWPGRIASRLKCMTRQAHSNLSRRKLMKDCRQFYIDGKWIGPTRPHDFQVINPATEEPFATISLGSVADVDNAVAAAKRAFESYSETTLDNRLAFLQRIIEAYQSKSEEMADTISREMGAPLS